MPDPFQLFRWILLHQGDAADPELIHWLKERMDEIFGVGPWVVVAVTASIIIVVPAAVCLFYYYQQRRGGTPLA